MNKKVKKGLSVALGLLLTALLLRTLLRLMMLLLAAATIAYLLFPTAHLLEKKLRMRPMLAAAVTFVLAAGILAAALYLGIPALIRQLGELGQSIPGLLKDFSDRADRLYMRLTHMGLPETMTQKLRSQAENLLLSLVQTLLTRLTQARNASKGFGYLLLAPLLAFYLLRDREALFSLLTRLIPSRIRTRSLYIALQVRKEIAAYVRGQMIVSVITGALTALGLAILGVPAFLALGAVMALCNLIPYFGPWLGAAPILLFCVSGGFRQVLGGILVVVLAQQIESLFVSPNIISQASSLHPGVVVTALLAGGWLAGLPGMLYAIPLVLACRALLRALLRTKTPSVL